MKNCSAQNARVTWFKGSCRIIPTARFSSPAGKQANRRSRSGPARRRPDCKECRSGPSPVRNADSSSSMLVPGLRPNDIAESGRRGDCSLRLPHYRTCGSASGDSWQSTRTEQHSFSATMIGPVAQPIGFSAPELDQRWSCLPAKFSPSRVVSSSGLFVSGSLLSVLWPLLTPVPACPPLLAASPAVADRPGPQVSLSKDANSRCTTGPFISGTEHRTALCGASSSVPSTLYGLSVRRLISFDLWLPSHGTSRFRSCLGLMFGPSCLSL